LGKLLRQGGGGGSNPQEKKKNALGEMRVTVVKHPQKTKSGFQQSGGGEGSHRLYSCSSRGKKTEKLKVWRKNS